MTIKENVVDPEVTLKAVPMYTTDEVEIKINSIIYRADWKSGYSFKAEAGAEIEALRVFHVNNTHRIFRARCAQGCESVFKMADGCARYQLYGNFKNAVKECHKKAKLDFARCEKKRDAVVKTAEAICSEVDRMKTLKETDIKEPKPITI